MKSDPLYRALIVDDEPFVRQAVVRALNNGRFTCDAAGDGRRALELARQSPYDVVVTDLHMPEANGHQLAVELLEMPARPAVVVLTGILEPKLSNDLRARGVDEILFKPVDFAALSKTLVALIEKRAEASPRKSLPNPSSTAALVQPSDVTESTSAPPVDAGIAATNLAANSLPQSVTAPTMPALSVAATLNAGEFAKEFAKIQAAINPIDRNWVWQSVVIFVAGLLVGWLLSWVGAGAAWH